MKYSVWTGETRVDKWTNRWTDRWTDRRKDRGTDGRDLRGYKKMGDFLFFFPLPVTIIHCDIFPIDPAVATGGSNTGPVWRFIQPPFEWWRQLQNKRRRQWQLVWCFFLKWKCDDTCDESRGSLGKSRVSTACGKRGGGTVGTFS